MTCGIQVLHPQWFDVAICALASNGVDSIWMVSTQYTFQRIAHLVEFLLHRCAIGYVLKIKCSVDRTCQSVWVIVSPRPS